MRDESLKFPELNSTISKLQMETFFEFYDYYNYYLTVIIITTILIINEFLLLRLSRMETHGMECMKYNEMQEKKNLRIRKKRKLNFIAHIIHTQLTH
jgi:hypothetical protein